ncbi:glycosyltransferase [Rufibacter hautae]|uniref:Glycosyltransferase family 4 protein n=1 Tax=Rufibacter hautae TaxID=2595005 RepID=A0A5B6TBB4_9BACT|nr:glycosyltransferase [Rufibacter hautae]KAA3437769.1 glycosyltransferase family 4 protein [Rufibacter hautae]
MAKSIVFTVTTDISHDQRMLRTANSLASAGYAVTLVGRLLPGSIELPSLPFRSHRIKCRFRKGPLFYLEYNLRLVTWFFSHRYDIYGAVDADTALAGLVTVAWRRKPLVYDAHELFPEMPEVVNRPLVKSLWALLEKIVFKRATLAYTVSGSLVTYFQQKYRGPVHLVRNMPVRQLSASLPASPPYFIYQGALNVGRGLENTIRAMQGVPAQLVICGTGPLMPQLVELTRELELQNKVIFKGNVPPTDLSRITAAAWAGIMLLDNQGLSYYYSLANKFFDYVQAGIPQVCVPFPEYVELNAHHEVALLVNNHVEEVRVALLTLLQEEEVYQKLQRNCLQAREEWTWETEEKHLLSLYAGL